MERRAIIDATESEDAQKDWPAIAQELRELLAVYGEKSGSFRRYAGDLLSLVQLANNPAKLYDRPLPFMPPGYELPLHLRLALGQASVDGAPVSAAVALAWARLAPEAYLRTPATRCADEFGKLFTEKYRQEFGTGMVLPRNRTKLKFVYRPASAGFRGYEEIKLTFGDIPDVSVLTAPVKKLQQIVEAATKALEPYSRYLGKNPDSKSALEGLLQLPATLWPQSAQTVLEGLKTRMGGGMIVLSFQELIENLDAKSALTKEKVFGLARALESMNIAMEPDVLAGAKVPKAEDKVVLFSVPPGEQLSRSTPAYQAAVLTLQLASSVATADGDFGVAELSHLRQQIQGWTHVTPSHQRRLLAHLRLLTTTPVSLTTLKKKLEPLSATAKETIASFMATVAQADGTVTPAEVKMLEKIYKALGVETKNVFSDVHTAAACNPKTAEQAGPKTGTGFKLDAARIAALQKDSEKVSRLLANIFTEEDLEAVVPVLESVVATEDVAKPGWLLGLDEAHASFARMLLSRPEWTRAELMDVTADLDLMLDGALEQLNEASFDKLDVAFTDGEDPVKVNNEVLEKIEA